MHSNNLNELAVLSLQESYSLSVLMYSIPAMSLLAAIVAVLTAIATLTAEMVH